MNTRRIVMLGTSPPQGVPLAGPGWQLVPAGGDAGAHFADLALVAGDCTLSEQQLDQLGLPLVIDLHAAAGADTAPALLDRAIGWLLPGDDGDDLAALVADQAWQGRAGVAESSVTAQHLAGLSTEARRIADALERLARETDADPTVPVSPVLVRRLIRLRRDRDRHFPAEIFGDPAWDMLLDLTAARMEGSEVTVSSLCVAAGVPTTTALRWIRTLTQAGLLERRVDTGDARRSFVALSDAAHFAMQAWIRRFATVFALR